MVSAREVSELLEEHPDLEPAVAAVLAAERPWDFHDVDVDSGAFGELVARGVVEQTVDGYHVPDRAAVERALAGDVEPEPADSDRSTPTRCLRSAVSRTSRRGDHQAPPGRPRGGSLVAAALSDWPRRPSGR